MNGTTHALSWTRRFYALLHHGDARCRVYDRLTARAQVPSAPAGRSAVVLPLMLTGCVKQDDGKDRFTLADDMKSGTPYPHRLLQPAAD